MADVVMPDQFNEQFTLYLNTEGKPVKRTLREMTAGEVLQAMDWQRDEANRLNAEAAPALAWGEAIEAGRKDDVPDLSPDEFRHAAAKLDEAADATVRAERLISLVLSHCPARYRKTPLQAGLPRWWPGGRAAWTR